MADIVSAEVRSRMMSGIRSKDTKPELLIRRGLHALGFRYRLHENRLPGKPDLVLPRFRAALFVNGCFWHGHDCHLFKLPATRSEFWKTKVGRNRANDKRNLELLEDLGWRTGVIWECAIKGKQRLPMSDVLQICATWLRSTECELEIRGV